MSVLGVAIAISIAAAIAAWLVGGVVLRGFGWLLMAAGLYGSIVGEPAYLVVFAGGLASWLAGHWHFALKHHRFRSPMAERIFAGLRVGSERDRRPHVS